jgi:hypothetical protein
MPLERDDANCCVRYFIGKVRILREGVVLLLAEKTPYDWVIRGGGLYILRRSQIRTTSQYDKRLNNLKMVKNWQFQRGNCSKYYEEKKLFEATYLPGLIGEW